MNVYFCRFLLCMNVLFVLVLIVKVYLSVLDVTVCEGIFVCVVLTVNVYMC